MRRGAEDKGGYVLCSGGCHRGIPRGLDRCPCRCHGLAIERQRSMDRVERATTASYGA